MASPAWLAEWEGGGGRGREGEGGGGRGRGCVYEAAYQLGLVFYGL